MFILEIFSWLVFGLVVGFVANLIDPNKDEGGIMGYIVLGILGSLFGGYMAQILGFRGSSKDFSLYSLITSVIGSLVLMFIYRMVKGTINKG